MIRIIEVKIGQGTVDFQELDGAILKNYLMDVTREIDGMFNMGFNY